MSNAREVERLVRRACAEDGPSVDPEAMRALKRAVRADENALRCAKAAADNIGENVSALAQDVFDALARTLPCKWNGDVIVVMDEVEVRGPAYDAATGTGQTDGAAERVQKVLALERAKLGL